MLWAPPQQSITSRAEAFWCGRITGKIDAQGIKSTTVVATARPVRHNSARTGKKRKRTHCSTSSRRCCCGTRVIVDASRYLTRFLLRGFCSISPLGCTLGAARPRECKRRRCSEPGRGTRAAREAGRHTTRQGTAYLPTMYVYSRIAGRHPDVDDFL